MPEEKDEKKPKRVKIGGMEIGGTRPAKPAPRRTIGRPTEVQKPDYSPDDITPEAVRAVEFPQAPKLKKGYDPDHVKAYLEAVAIKLSQLSAGGGRADTQALEARIRELEEENRKLREQLAQGGMGKEEAEGVAAKIIADAREFAEHIKEKAQREAQDEKNRIIGEAEARRREIEAEADRLRGELERLKAMKSEIVAQVERVLGEMAKMLEKYKE